MALLAGRMAALGTENAFRLGEDIARCEARGLRVIRMNLGEPDVDSAEHINQAAIEQIRSGNSHYCDPAGILSFREAIARHLSETRGLEVESDRVVVTTGAKPPIGYAFQTYVEPGDEVIYPSPGFPIYESWATFLGARPVPLLLREEEDFSFSAAELSDLLTPKTKLIILCSPSNPTGGVLGQQQLSEMAQVIRERCHPDVRVYSDEIYEHVLFDGESHHSIASETGMSERTIIASGHSKGFAMTGWRLGYAVLPSRDEARCFKQLNINTVSCVPPFIQEAGREAYENPLSQETVARMVSAFQRRRDWLVAALNEVPGLHCQTPKGAFYVFPNVEGLCRNLGIFEAYAALPEEAGRRESPSRMLQMFLLHGHGVATMDRNSFGRIGAEGQHFLRLSLATRMDLLKEGVERIRRAAGDREGFERFWVG